MRRHGRRGVVADEAGVLQWWVWALGAAGLLMAVPAHGQPAPGVGSPPVPSVSRDGAAGSVPQTGVIAPPATGSMPVIAPPAVGTMPVIRPPVSPAAPASK